MTVTAMSTSGQMNISAEEISTGLHMSVGTIVCAGHINIKLNYMNFRIMDINMCRCKHTTLTNSYTDQNTAHTRDAKTNDAT
jgi:hypothetical protein